MNPEPGDRLPGKLGWVRGTRDPRTLKLSTYTTPDLPAPPPQTDWAARVKTWPLYSNDRIGCCVVASCAHLVQSWTRYAAGTEHVIDEHDVIGTYAAVSGYDPATGANDNGATAIDVLNVWRQTGIGGRKIVAFMRLDPHDDAEIRTAIHLFGGIVVGALMPTDADRQFKNNLLWTPTHGDGSRPGTWGGHAMHVGGYTPRRVTFTTWGQKQCATWNWWHTYIAEAYAAVSTDWLTSSGRTPLGFDTDAMLADLQRITADNDR